MKYNKYLLEDASVDDSILFQEDTDKSNPIINFIFQADLTGTGTIIFEHSFDGIVWSEVNSLEIKNAEVWTVINDASTPVFGHFRARWTFDPSEEPSGTVTAFWSRGDV